MARNGAESSINSQWPGGTSVTRRASSKVQFDDARKNFSGLDFGQQIGERSFGVARGEFAGGGEKIFRRTLDLLREPVPVEAVNGFGGNDFVQRFQGPGGLRAGAAVIFAAQAGGLFGRREAKDRAGRRV